MHLLFLYQNETFVLTMYQNDTKIEVSKRYFNKVYHFDN